VRRSPEFNFNGACVTSQNAHAGIPADAGNVKEEEIEMKTSTMASAVSLVLLTGNALAQTTATQSTTVTSPATAPAPVTPPPPGTLSTTETKKIVTGNGEEYDSTQTTYGSVNGAATQSASTTSVQPATPAIVTMKKTTTVTTSN